MSLHVTDKPVTSQLVPACALCAPGFPALTTRDSSPTHKLVSICVANYFVCRHVSATRSLAYTPACMPACVQTGGAGGGSKRHNQRPILPAHTFSPGRCPSRFVYWLVMASRTQTSPLAWTAPSRCQHACHNPPLTSLSPSVSIAYATPLSSFSRALQGLIHVR